MDNNTRLSDGELLRSNCATVQTLHILCSEFITNRYVNVECARELWQVATACNDFILIEKFIIMYINR